MIQINLNQFQIGARPAVRTGNVVRAEIEVGGNASDYAALQHELLEVGESDQSYDPDTDQPRRRPGYTPTNLLPFSTFSYNIYNFLRGDLYLG